MSAYFGAVLKEQHGQSPQGFENIEVPVQMPLRVRYVTPVT
jgi:hypothetical protein